MSNHGTLTPTLSPKGNSTPPPLHGRTNPAGNGSGNGISTELSPPSPRKNPSLSLNSDRNPSSSQASGSSIGSPKGNVLDPDPQRRVQMFWSSPEETEHFRARGCGNRTDRWSTEQRRDRKASCQFSAPPPRPHQSANHREYQCAEPSPSTSRRSPNYCTISRLPTAYKFKLLGEDLAGVIMGCTDDTKEECLNNLIFGLPAKHWDYLQHVEAGMTFYLFNYTRRTLHGIFRSVESATWMLNKTGWCPYSDMVTPFPAQIRVERIENCPPLAEAEYGPILAHKNSYIDNTDKFSFELDEGQVELLSELFRSTKNRYPDRDEPPFIARGPPSGLYRGLARKQYLSPRQMSVRSSFESGHGGRTTRGRGYIRTQGGRGYSRTLGESTHPLAVDYGDAATNPSFWGRAGDRAAAGSTAEPPPGLRFSSEGGRNRRPATSAESRSSFCSPLPPPKTT